MHEDRLNEEPLSEPDDAPLDAAESLAIIAAQRAVVRDRAEPDSRLLLAVWGVAWLVGHLALFVSANASAVKRPDGWAYAVLATGLAAAIAATIVHTARRTSGVEGPNATSGAMFGFSWSIAFVGVTLVMVGLTRAGASPDVITLGWSGLSCLVVGLMYVTGGALWHSVTMYVLGAWLVVVGGAATLIGLPWSFLVMALAGGGGFLVGAFAVHRTAYRTAS